MIGTHATVSLPWSWSSLLCQSRAGQTHSSPQCLGAATNVPCHSTRCRGLTCAIHSACVVQKFPLIVTMEISEVRLRLALPLLRFLLGNRRAEISGRLRPQDRQSLWVASDLSLQNFVDSCLGNGVRQGVLPIVEISKLVKLHRFFRRTCGCLPCCCLCFAFFLVEVCCFLETVPRLLGQMSW